MLLAVVMGLLLLASLAAFVIPLRFAGRTAPDAPTRPPGHDGATFVGLDHLAVGVELQFDGQRWFVRGVQHVTSPDGAAWSAWHLEDRGQGGRLQTAGPDDEVLFAVRAERPDALDPSADAVDFRGFTWDRVAVAGGAVRAEGERSGPRRAGLRPVSGADVEQVVFARPELPARRLVLERSVDEETWNAWIGTSVPGRLVDVWPPAASPGAP